MTTAELLALIKCPDGQISYDRRKLYAEEEAALDFCDFQLGTVRDYMEPPGSPELENAYKHYVSEPDVNR